MEQEVCPACRFWDDMFQRCRIIGLDYDKCQGEKFKLNYELEDDDE